LILPNNLTYGFFTYEKNRKQLLTDSNPNLIMYESKSVYNYL